MTIQTAILLAAGEGSRLRGAAAVKPLCPVAGAALIDHALNGLAAAGMSRVIVVLGYGGHAIAKHLASRDWPLIVETVQTPDYRQPNGVSALAAWPLAGDEEALLVMCDHLAEPALYRRLAEAGAWPGVSLGVDRRLDSAWVDPADVTYVRTEGDRIVAIGKGLPDHDCHDTGVFAVGPRLFEALAASHSPSLTDGVRALAEAGRARAVDCTGLGWIDVDDPAALAHAEAWVASRDAVDRAAGR